MILGLDPGRNKIGWALVDCEGKLILSGIFLVSELEVFLEILERPADKWEEELAFWTHERQSSVPESEVAYVALGDGTGSRDTALRLGRLRRRMVLVDERETTLAARELYWRLHGPVWWQRILPRSLRIPPRNVDDMAAWGIALRSLEARPRHLETLPI